MYGGAVTHTLKGYMSDVTLAIKTGNEQLKNKIAKLSGEFSYEDTAYHLPVSYALTGTPVHTPQAAAEVLTKTADNPWLPQNASLQERRQRPGKNPRRIRDLSAIP